jgi:hypothetical protein
MWGGAVDYNEKGQHDVSTANEKSITVLHRRRHRMVYEK